LELLDGLLDSRVMTLAQVAALYFDGKSEYAKKRVAKLKSAKLISERPRKTSQPSILSLTREGYRTLLEEGYPSDEWRMDWPAMKRRLQVSELTLRHELDVMDVKVAFCSAVRKTSNCTIEKFTTWPARCQFTVSRGRGGEAIVKPDGFIRICERKGEDVFEHV